MPDLYDMEPPADQHQARDAEVMEAGAMALSAGTAMQRIGGNYVTAMSVQKKRSLEEVRRALLDEARLAGERFFYGWGAGKDRVEGPSEALAHAAARCFGNCAVEPAPIQDAGDSWIFTAFFIDLETGFTIGRQFRQSKRWTVYGKMDAERKADVRFQIGASKAARNVILKALPAVLVDDAMAEAKKGVRKKIEAYVERKGLPAAQDLALSRLKQLNVEEDRVLARFQIAERKALTIEHLTILQGDIKALEDGAERPEELFPGNGGSGPEVAARSGLDAFAEAGSNQPPPEPPAHLSASQVEELRSLAAKAKVDWTAVEEAYGGPVENLELDGKRPVDLEAEIVQTIKDLGKGQK